MFRRVFCALAVLSAIVLGCGCAEAAAPLPASIGPYLQNPSANGMTVCFLTPSGTNSGTDGVRVLWLRQGAPGKPAEAAAKGTAIPGTPWTIWKARLTPLQPGATYEYQIRQGREKSGTTTPAYRFHSMDPHAKTFRAAFFNDIHNREATLEAVMKNVKPEDYEMAFLLGDMWTNPSPAKEADQVFRTLEAYIRLLDGAEKPMVVVRGNHETIGGFAGKMAYLFDIPGLDAAAGEFEQQWQFTLQTGPVWLMGLDGGDDFIKRLEKFQPMRQRQAEWMKGVLARKEGAGCWRVLLTHMPVYNDNCWNSEPCRQMWEPVLSGAAIDLEISGHEHNLCKLLPKGKTYEIIFNGHYPDQQDPQQRKKWSCILAWSVLIGGGPAMKGGEAGEVKLMNADEKTLTVRCFGIHSNKPLATFTFDAKAK